MRNGSLGRRTRAAAALIGVGLLAVVALVLVATGGGNASAAGGGTDVGPSLAQIAQARHTRPNIILISTDDQAVADLPWMPILRRELARQGTTFDRMLSPHPLCCPARAAILTGQYAQNNGVKSNQYPYNFHALQVKTTLPVWLHNAGYQTAFAGKYLNGYLQDGRRQPGWDFWDPTMVGEYAYTPFQAGNDGHPAWYRHTNNVDYINTRVNTLVDDYSADYRATGRPFFIWASHVGPHGRYDRANGVPSTSVAFPPRRFAHRFSTVESPSLSQPGWMERDVSDKNSLVQRKRPVTRAKVDKVFRSRIQTLQGVDQGIGQLIEHLRADGTLDNTYIFFTSDNGFELGQHHLLTKNVPYHESVRVPLIVRGPGIAAGAVNHQRALMVDLAPTFADLAGAKPLVAVDGVSLMPTLRTGSPLRSTVLIQAGPGKRVDTGRFGWWWRGVTTDRYTYAHFYKNRLEELYDRELDPAENVNVSGDPAYASVLNELRRRTRLLIDCSGPAECSRTFPEMPTPNPSLEDGTMSRATDPK